MVNFVLCSMRCHRQRFCLEASVKDVLKRPPQQVQCLTAVLLASCMCSPWIICLQHCIVFVLRTYKNLADIQLNSGLAALQADEYAKR
jgi:hypothetical protein